MKTNISLRFFNVYNRGYINNVFRSWRHVCTHFNMAIYEVKHKEKEIIKQKISYTKKTSDEKVNPLIKDKKKNG